MAPHSRPERQRFLAKIAVQSSGCWLWTGGERLTQGGVPYGRFTTADGRSMSAHRFSYQLFVGPIPSGALICHHCDVPLCVRPSHLYAGTDATNARDRDRRHRRDRRAGERHHNAKLTEAQVAEIRARYAAGGSGHRGRRGTITYRDLAAEYGVAWRVIGKIVRGEIWH